MGLLSEGRPLTWKEIVAVRHELKRDALNELIEIFHRHKDRHGDQFTWGDEVELTLLRFDRSKKHVQLLLKAHQYLEQLRETNEKIDDPACRIAWHPEACDSVLEGVPHQAYGYLPAHFNVVEANLRLRREQVQQLLNRTSDCEFILNLSAFPRFGEGDYTFPPIDSGEEHSLEKSRCFPDALMSPLHPRTKSMSANLHERRQCLASIDIPIYRDVSTARPFVDPLFVGVGEDLIHLDSSTAGWGCCCLQVTFQAESFEESLHLHDQLLVLCPLMLCLSSSCPIWRGYLSEIDCRWNVLSAAADDRTAEEKQLTGLPSRFCSSPLYLEEKHKDLNDLDLSFDEDVLEKLTNEGMSECLSRHFAHLFLRDPLVILDEFVQRTDSSPSYHFENLNSLVWNTLRFKPPSMEEQSLGWRIEFRPMDIQISDFENAALVVFVALLTRMLLTYQMDLTIPISQISENMNVAHRRDAVREEKFFFRYENVTSRLSLNEIMNGQGDFPGLVPLVRDYLHQLEDVDVQSRHTVEQYLLLVSKRAAGTLLTNAHWMRQFVMSHPMYKQDSIVTEEIQYDLISKIERIANGHEECPLIKQTQMHTDSDLHLV